MSSAKSSSSPWEGLRRATDAIYMNYPGIKGGVTAAGHEGWIELNSVQLGCEPHRFRPDKWFGSSAVTSCREPRRPPSLTTWRQQRTLESPFAP